MRKQMRIFLLTSVMVLSMASMAQAQNVWQPAGRGGAMITTPGQYPTMINPMLGGGYMATTPGQYPTMIQPMMGGGYMATTPGQYPTMIRPR